MPELSRDRAEPAADPAIISDILAIAQHRFKIHAINGKCQVPKTKKLPRPLHILPIEISETVRMRNIPRRASRGDLAPARGVAITHGERREPPIVLKSPLFSFSGCRFGQKWSVSTFGVEFPDAFWPEIHPP